MRWQQFENLVAGKAPMPEPGFALALYYQVSGDRNAGRQAVEWALAPGSDLRQVADGFRLVPGHLGPGRVKALSARIESRLRNRLPTEASRQSATGCSELSPSRPRPDAPEP